MKKKPETEVVTFRIEKTTMDRIRKQAVEEGRDYTQQIRWMLKKQLEQEV